MADTILYEYPLNERIRLLLRFEHLLRQFEHASESISSWDSRQALLTLFDLIELISRSELRGELGKLLNQLRKRFGTLRDHAAVDSDVLDGILEDLDRVTQALHAMHSGELDVVGQQSFLQMVRQRSTIPGGSCAFDLPALHHWLEACSSVERSRQLWDWIKPLQPLHDGTRRVLALLRDSAPLREEQAPGGRYRYSLENLPNAPQLLRLDIATEQRLYPEFSGDTHRVSIRFLSQETPERQARQTETDVAFRLAYCRI